MKRRWSRFSVNWPGYRNWVGLKVSRILLSISLTSSSSTLMLPHYFYRSAEFIALIAVSCTLFLFLHTQSLTSRLREMEDKLQPSEMSASGLSGNSIIQQGKWRWDNFRLRTKLWKKTILRTAFSPTSLCIHSQLLIKWAHQTLPSPFKW